jgi:hypothetical protein
METIVSLSNIISAITWIIALIVSILVLKRVNNINIKIGWDNISTQENIWNENKIANRDFIDNK